MFYKRASAKMVQMPWVAENCKYLILKINNSHDYDFLK